MADVKISSMTAYRPVDSNTMFVATFVDPEGATGKVSGKALGLELAKYINGLVKAGNGISVEHNANTGEVTIINAYNHSLFVVLTAEPEITDMQENKIYLVPSSSTGTDNVYVEYALVDGKKEKLGEHVVGTDMNLYVTKDALTTEIATINSSISAITADVTELKTTTNTLDTTVSSLQTTHTKDKSDLETAINGVRTLVTDLTDTHNSDKAALETKINELVIPSLEGYATQEWVEAKKYLTSVPAGYATQEWVEAKKYLTSVPTEYITQTRLDSMSYVTTSALTPINSKVTEVESKQAEIISGYTAGDAAVKTWVTDNFIKPTDVDTKITAAINGLENYDDTDVKNRITSLESIDHTLFLKAADLTDYAKTNDVDSKDDAIKDLITVANSTISTLQDRIKELEDKLAQYDYRFGYPDSTAPETPVNWSKSFLLVDE